MWCHPQVQKKSSLFLNGNTKISTAATPEAISAKWVVNHIQDRCCFYVFPNCLNTKVWDMMTLQLHSKYVSQDSSFHICPYILLLCGLIRLYYNLCAEKRTHMQRVINSSAQSIHCFPPQWKELLCTRPKGVKWAFPQFPKALWKSRCDRMTLKDSGPVAQNLGKGSKQQ